MRLPRELKMKGYKHSKKRDDDDDDENSDEEQSSIGSLQLRICSA